MFCAFLLQFFIAFDVIYDVFDVVDEALAIRKATEHKGLPAMWALTFTFLNPCS